MLLGYRSNDAVVTICQNNVNKSIKISDVNAQAEELIGYRASELVGQSLDTILPQRISSLLHEYVEFEADANDVGSVLGKVQSFSMVDKNGKETVFRMKLARAQSSSDTFYFALVLYDTMGLRKNEALRKIIQENFKGHEVLDPVYGLPNAETLQKDIEVMGRYGASGDVLSCFAIMQLDQYSDMITKYGQAHGENLLKHVAFIARQSLRPDDLVGVVSEKRIGILLVDTQPESARMVCNRLRWQIAANPYMVATDNPVGLSVSIAFCRIGGKVDNREIYHHCESSLDVLRPDATGAMIEVA